MKRIILTPPPLPLNITLVGTTWLISKDKMFTDLSLDILRSENDLVDLLEKDIPYNIGLNEVIFIKVKFHFSNGSIGEFSETMMINHDLTTNNNNINILFTPSIYIDDNLDDVNLNRLTIKTKPMTFFKGSGQHVSTNWKVLTTSGEVLFNRENDIDNLESISLDKNVVRDQSVVVVTAVYNTDSDAKCFIGKRAIVIEKHIDTFLIKDNKINVADYNSLTLVDSTVGVDKVSWNIVNMESGSIISGITTGLTPFVFHGAELKDYRDLKLIVTVTTGVFKQTTSLFDLIVIDEEMLFDNNITLIEDENGLVYLTSDILPLLGSTTEMIGDEIVPIFNLLDNSLYPFRKALDGTITIPGNNKLYKGKEVSYRIELLQISDEGYVLIGVDGLNTVLQLLVYDKYSGQFGIVAEQTIEIKNIGSFNLALNQDIEFIYTTANQTRVYKVDKRTLELTLTILHRKILDGTTYKYSFDENNILFINDVGEFTIVDSEYNELVEKTSFRTNTPTETLIRRLNDDQILVLSQDSGDFKTLVHIINKDGSVIVKPHKYINLSKVTVVTDRELKKIYLYSEEPENLPT